MDVQATIGQFAAVSGEHPTATRLLQLSHIIDLLRDVLSPDAEDWRSFLTGLGTRERQFEYEDCCNDLFCFGYDSEDEFDWRL